MQFETPILFLVFNRPDTTRKVFEKIRDLRPAKFFVAADGPRAGKDGEKEKCEQVRKLIMSGIDWPCEVKTLFRESNLGCGHAVSGAITWFFENVEEGIILEDDTLPDPSFFPFCKAMLEKYRQDEKIKMISGNNFRRVISIDNSSYYFTSLFHIWGWATWRRVWKDYCFDLKEWNENSLRSVIKEHFSDREIVRRFTSILLQIKEQQIDTWDFQFALSIWNKNGINIAPSKNLVSNIGFGKDALHTLNEKDEFAKMPVFVISNIYHPKQVVIDRRSDQEVARRILYIRESVFKRAIKKVIRNFIK